MGYYCGYLSPFRGVCKNVASVRYDGGDYCDACLCEELRDTSVGEMVKKNEDTGAETHLFWTKKPCDRCGMEFTVSYGSDDGEIAASIGFADMLDWKVLCPRCHAEKMKRVI